MRLSPLICWECSNWFIPKTLHKTKFCCNACKQQFHLKDKGEHLVGYDGMVQFWHETEQDRIEFEEIIRKYCTHDKCFSCIECLFQKNYNLYCKTVAKQGRDGFGISVREWMRRGGKTNL